MPEQKCILHSAEEFFGKRTNQKIVKDELRGSMGSRSEAMEQYKKSDRNFRKSLRFSRSRRIC